MHSPLPFCSANHAEQALEERTKALADLLAVGLLRLQLRLISTDGSDRQKPSESHANELAVGGEKSVTVHAG